MRARPRSAWLLAGVTLLIAYALVLFHHTSRAVGGSDSSGYLNAARLFAVGHATEPIRGLERLQMPDEFAPVFIPLGYTTAREPRRMAGSYPPGMPLHLALAGKLGGWSTAPFLVSPIAGLACLVLIYLLGRELRLTPPFAFAASLLLAFFPTFVFIVFQPMSDVLATAWALTAIHSGYRSRRARDGRIWAALAGLAFGIGVLVRPTNAILLAPLVLALPLRPRSWLSFLAGGAPAAIVLLGYNRAVFGSPFSTGYQTLLAEAMAWSNFPDRARHYGYWIGRLLTPIVPIGWLAVAADRRAPLRDRAVLLSWFAAFFLFYCFYVVYEAWWYTRFLLPAVPALILGSLLVAQDLVVGDGGARRVQWKGAIAIALVIAVLGVEMNFDEKNRVHRFYKGERIYPHACEMARRRVPQNGIVLSMQMSGALHYYTPLTYAMWNWLLPERFAVLRASTESRGHRWYALLAPFETVEVRKNFPGDWREIDRVGDVALWELPPLPR